MNGPTLLASLAMAAVLILAAALVFRQMARGWVARAARQTGALGALPALPDTVGPAIVGPTRGLYVGSSVAPDWNTRVVMGDLGPRSKAVLTRYPEGIMLQRSGARPIWIPDESITAIRTERGLAGRALTFEGILAIRWRLPSGTEIDTGFRGDDRRDLTRWTGEDAA